MADDALQLDLGTIECNVGVDADGIEWNAVLVDDIVNVRGGQIAPTGRHGVSLTPNLRGGRLFAPEGSVVAPTQALAWDAIERLRALGFDESFDIVWHETVPKFVTVTQRGPASTDDPIRGVFEYKLDLIAAYPFRRALTGTTLPASSGATVELTNNGTVPAHPVITTTGSGAVDFTIGGRSFTTDSVPSGTVIDMWARTITDGSGVTIEPWPKHSAAEWLAIPRGSVDLVNSGAALSVSWHDTYA